MKQNTNHRLSRFHTQSGLLCSAGCCNSRDGVSTGLFKSLNVGRFVGDEPLYVEKNRLQVKNFIGASHLLSAKQVHGDQIHCLESTIEGDMEVGEVDALITSKLGVALMIQQADCQAVLIFDPVQEVIAAVHCGWRGSVLNILRKTVEKMLGVYGTMPQNLKVVVSPSLGPCCAEFINCKAELPASFEQFMVKANYFDFWQVSKFQLVNTGVLEQNIQITGVCTCCNDDYFSYRRATRLSGGITGRNCSVIVFT